MHYIIIKSHVRTTTEAAYISWEDNNKISHLYTLVYPILLSRSPWYTNIRLYHSANMEANLLCNSDKSIPGISTCLVPNICMYGCIYVRYLRFSWGTKIKNLWYIIHLIARGHSICKGGHIFPNPNSPSLSVHVHKQCRSLLKKSLIAVFCTWVGYQRHVRTF